MRRLAVAVGLMCARSAAAQPDGFDLEWRGPAGCPDEPEVRARIAAAADGAALAAVRVAAMADRVGASWRVVVVLGDERRVLTGATCDEVASAAALVIGLALRRAQEEKVEPSAEEPVTAPPSPPEPLRVERRAAPQPSSMRLAARAEAGAEIRTLPAIAAVVSGGAGLSGKRIGAWVGVSYATSGAPAEPDGVYSSARVTRIAGVARACATASALSVCAGAEVGRMAATVASPEDRDAGAGLWVAAAAGAAIGIPLGRIVELGLGADLVLPIAYPRFSVNGIETLPAPGVVGGRLAGSLRVHFR